MVDRNAGVSPEQPHRISHRHSFGRRRRGGRRRSHGRRRQHRGTAGRRVRARRDLPFRGRLSSGEGPGSILRSAISARPNSRTSPSRYASIRYKSASPTEPRPAISTGPAAKEAALAQLALPDQPSIAVLPFQNMSGDPEQDYFCDGMVEDITTGLSRIKWLFVIARNSSFTYKGRSVDVRQVGRDLGVRYVLEGGVPKAGARVRITGQLVNALDRERMFGRTASTESWLTFSTCKIRLRRGWLARSRPSSNKLRLNGQSANRPRASMPTTISCAVWRRFINLPSRATKKRWGCSPAPSNSIPTSLRPMECPRAATCSVKGSDGWAIATERSPKPPEWRGAP